MTEISFTLDPREEQFIRSFAKEKNIKYEQAIVIIFDKCLKLMIKHKEFKSSFQDLSKFMED